MKKVKIKLGSNSYEVHIDSGILSQTGRKLKEAGFADKVVIITNPVVKSLYGEALEQSLTPEGFTVTTLQVPDG